jgi:SEC-C motif-containing protein
MPYHSGVAIPPNAEALMRSRYTAYVLANAEYLKATWHPKTLPQLFNLDDQDHTQWLGLKIIRHETSDENHAIVEFVARYKINGKAHRLHEVSRFVREGARWYYLDGEIE